MPVCFIGKDISNGKLGVVVFRAKKREANKNGKRFVQTFHGN